MDAEFGPWPPFPNHDLYSALEGATLDLARLDVALVTVSPALARGWLARMALEEAVASSRLNGALVDVADLRLLAFDALDRAPDPDLAQALPLHDLIRRAVLRHPRHLFTPLRLSALVRLRREVAHRAPLDTFPAREPDGWRAPSDVSSHDFAPPWDSDAMGEPKTMAVLATALDPTFLKGLETFPALVGAALFLAHWHRSGAERLLGAAAGRILAGWWPARRGAVREWRQDRGGGDEVKGLDTILMRPFPGGPLLMPSLGFLGHAMNYRPDQPHTVWVAAFVAAAGRALARGEALRQKLKWAEARLNEALRPRRSTSRGPQVAQSLLLNPVVTPARLARDLSMSDTAARQTLEALARERLVEEISGRDSFRAYALT